MPLFALDKGDENFSLYFKVLLVPNMSYDYANNSFTKQLTTIARGSKKEKKNLMNMYERDLSHFLQR